jgi:hypothetical protein
VSSAVGGVVRSKSNRQHPRDFIDSYAVLTQHKRRLQILYVSENTVVYLLKARTVEPEKQPLLANGSETTFVSRQTPRNEQRPLLGSRLLIMQQLDYNNGRVVFSTRFVTKNYKRDEI